jgi:transcriptional regulator with XRE-family HTH domain
MAGQERRDDVARRAAQTAIEMAGREVRRARLELDLSQATAAASIGRSGSAWSRLERGDAPAIPLVDLFRAAAVVGLDLRISAYPGGQPLRDAAHLALLERLRVRLGPAVRWQTEVPLPMRGDRRAWDAVARVPAVRVGIEAETRGRDAQTLQRRIGLKRRDGGVDHVILLLADTRHNRRFLRSAGAGFLADFPLPASTVLARLSAGQDPEGSAVILL